MAVSVESEGYVRHVVVAAVAVVVVLLHLCILLLPYLKIKINQQNFFFFFFLNDVLKIQFGLTFVNSKENFNMTLNNLLLFLLQMTGKDVSKIFMKISGCYCVA